MSRRISMARKDSDKDTERPHYYSQFWLDVAAGRRVIGQPKGDENEGAEVETPEPVSPRRVGRAGGHEEYNSSRSAGDGHLDDIVHPVAEPLATPEEFIEPEPEEIDLAPVQDDELEYQDVGADEDDIPDMDLDAADASDEDEFFDEEEEDEDEDDLGWGGARGRKKTKPSRPVKPPVRKPGRRERRGF